MQDKKRIKITIIVRTYDSEKTIAKTIKSIIAQNYSEDHFEIIVVDDKSIDRTISTVEKINFPNMKIVRNSKNFGSARSANIGIKNSSGDYIILLDSDDLFEKTILKEMANVLDNSPQIDFVYSDYFERSLNGEKKIILTNNIFNTGACGIMFRREKIMKEGFYRANLKFPEYDLLLRVKDKWKGFRLKKPLFWYIRRKESQSANRSWLKKAMLELKKNHPDKVEEINKIREY